MAALGSFELGFYLEHLCDGHNPFIADVVVFKVDACNGGVCLLEKLDEKEWLAGGANQGQNASKV